KARTTVATAPIPISSRSSSWSVGRIGVFTSTTLVDAHAQVLALGVARLDRVIGARPPVGDPRPINAAARVEHGAIELVGAEVMTARAQREQPLRDDPILEIGRAHV